MTGVDQNRDVEVDVSWGLGMSGVTWGRSPLSDVPADPL